MYTVDLKLENLLPLCALPSEVASVCALVRGRDLWTTCVGSTFPELSKVAATLFSMYVSSCVVRKI